MRKKFSTIPVVLFLLMVVSFPLLSIELGSSSIIALRSATLRSFTFTASLLAPQFSKMCGYDVITIPTCGVTTDVGKPMLPVKIVPVLLPPDADVEKIELTTSQKEDLTGSYKVFPAQPPVAGVESRLPEFVKPDQAVYDSDKAYPSVVFENSGVCWMQGYKILNVKIFPVQYFPRIGKLTYYEKMNFIVTVTSAGLAPSRNTFSDAKDMISRFAANPEKADEWVSPSAKASSTPSIDYVIITSSSFQDEFQVLADWKIYAGISAGVYNTTWIYNNYAGVDNQEKIRNFIIDMYNTYGTSMVLLGGDYNVVPPRYIYMEDCLDDYREAGGGLTAHYKATDYYYSCLDGDWDLDDDHRYLEQTDMDLDGRPETCIEPIPDFYPEVYVGRMPASSEAIAEFLVARTISYQVNYPPLGLDWGTNALLLGAIANYQNEAGKGWDKTDHAEELEWVRANVIAGLNVTTMYEKDGLSPSTFPCTYPLTKSNVETSLSSGCYIMSTGGHGSVLKQWKKIWAWDDGDNVPENGEMNWTPFIDSAAMTLSNGNKLPQVYMEACFNGKFDDTTYDCVAEWLLKLSGGGAIAVTAASRISYYCVGWRKGWPYNQELLCLFWQEFSPEKGPGKILYDSKLNYYLEGFPMTHYANKKNLLIYNLLGDPHIKPLTTTIHIRADGSVDPPMAPISSADNVTYTFTNDIYYVGIVVERNDAIIDGNGYTLQGTGSGRGFRLSGVNNVTIQNTNIKDFDDGIWLSSSSFNTISGNHIANNKGWGGVVLCMSQNNTVSGNYITNNSCGVRLEILMSFNTISGNTITNNDFGVLLDGGSNEIISGNTITNNGYGVRLRLALNNTVSGNHITNNEYGVWLDSCSNNKFYHNNFIDNTHQVHNDASTSTWDDNYPSGGNYWCNYTGVDLSCGPYQNETGSDGIYDNPYIIDINNQDNYPFKHPNGWQNYPITIESNVTITEVITTENALHFKASGPDGLVGYVNATMPVGLNTTEIQVFIDGVKLTPPPFPIITTNSTHYFIYFEFTLSTHEITIQYAPAPADIAITNAKPSKTIVGQGYKVSINVTVENQGLTTETFNVTAYANTTVINQTEVTLPSGNSTTVTLTWNTTGVAKGNYTITAEATSLPGETDTEDNILTDGTVTVTIPGDVDGDFDVDIYDIVKICAAYDSEAPEPPYEPNLDVNCDGVINIYDVVIACAHYDEHYP